jgi:hypothetical protein
MVGMLILMGLFCARATNGKPPTAAAATAPDNTSRRLRRLLRLLDMHFLRRSRPRQCRGAVVAFVVKTLK